MTDQNQDPTPLLESDDHAKATAHPPLMLLIWIAGGLILGFVLSPILNLPAWIRGLAFIDVMVAFALFGWAMATFKRVETDVKLNTPADNLATDGPYAFSRNPIYLAMMILGLGLGFALSNIWLILGAIPFYYIISTKVIAPEETYMREKFGADYDAYCQKVRRWI